MKNEKEIIQLWKELQITHIDFEFSCGGDSMNDTTLNIHKGDEIIENDVISTYFENEVYNEVRFYEASDGHYMGEMGNVIIHLNDEDEGFTYNKQAQSEFNETMTTDLEIELTDEEKLIVDLLKANNNQMDLGALKAKSELSGKKWDAATKGLSQHKLIKVSVAGDSKIMELIG